MKRQKTPSKKPSPKKPSPTKASPKKPQPPQKLRWLHTGFGVLLAGAVLLSVWLVVLDAQVREAFDGRKWALPAKVYARPLSLYPGLMLSPAQLESELMWADYRQQSVADRAGTFQRNGDTWTIQRRGFPFWDEQESARTIQLTLRDGYLISLSDQQGEQPLIRLEPQYIGGIFRPTTKTVS